MESASNKTKVLILPDWTDGNPYQNLLAEALSAKGLCVRFGHFPDGCFPLARAASREKGVSVVHLHWVNDLLSPILWSRSPLRRALRRMLLVLDVWWLRLRGVRVVWTIHNLLAHESSDTAAERIARRVLASACSSLIVHSESALHRLEAAYKASLRSKTFIVPHGNYDGCYPINPDKANVLRAKCDIGEESLVILYFGAIRPYKGVMQLLQVFAGVDRPNLRLIVAGRPISEELESEVRSAIQDDERILPLLDFVATEDVSALFEVADIVAIPFENTLTSGSVILALTMGRPLLLPEDARVLDAVNDDCAVFYDTPEALEHALRSLDKTSLARMRAEATRLAAERSWDNVARRTEAAYRGYLSRAWN